MFCFLGRCLEYGLHDGHKNVVCDNYLILSGLSMDRIGRLQLDKRIRKRERTYTGGSKRAWDVMVPEVATINERRKSRVGRRICLWRCWYSVTCVAIFYSCARLPRWSLGAGTVSKIEDVVSVQQSWGYKAIKDRRNRSVSGLWAECGQKIGPDSWGGEQKCSGWGERLQAFFHCNGAAA